MLADLHSCGKFINKNVLIRNNKNDFYNKKITIKTNKAKSNHHIGKIIFFGLISVGVGLYFGWLYALIPIAALIFFIISDQIFNFCPVPKKILSYVMPCLSCLKETEEEKVPEQDKNASIEGMKIKN